jgi:hypothetical protein
MAGPLAQLLVGLTEEAAPLAHAESLDEFKAQGRHVARSCQLTPQQLAGARAALQAMGSSDWGDLARAGVALPDAAKCVGARARVLLGWSSSSRPCGGALPCQHVCPALQLSREA